MSVKYITKNIKTSPLLSVKVKDISCNEVGIFNHIVTWTSVFANYNFLYPQVTSVNVRLQAGMAQEYGVLWGGKHINSNFARLYVLRYGRGSVTYADRTVKLRPGQLYLFPDGRTADYSCSAPIYLQWLHFRP